MRENFDFDTWADLAKRDPAAFEEARRLVVERLIAACRDQERLRRLQWRIDAERHRAKTPLKACLRLSSMMWETFADLRGALNRLTDSPVKARREIRLVSIRTKKSI